MIQLDPKRRIAVAVVTKREEEEHFFSLVCTPETSTDALRELGKMAADPELPFGWVDAAQVAEQIRRRVYEIQHPPTASAEGPKDLPPGMRRG